MLIDLVGLFIMKTDSDLQRCRICCIALFTLLDRVLCTFHVKRKVGELQAELATIIGDRRNIRKCFTQSFIQKPLVGIALNLDQVRHIKNFLFTGIAHSHAAS